jgi:1-deoxy-D-xylulose-5-phosphate synthase
MVAPALNAANRLNATIIDMRFVKPLDENLISDMVTRHQLLVTVEENAIAGGAGSAVNEFLLRRNYQIPVLNLGLPDEFTSHGKAPEMLSGVSLDSGSIEAAIKSKMVACKLQSEAV